MSVRKTALTATKLAITPIFTALVAVATIIFVISIPATSGYFNIGETIIYITAILFGPYVGAFSGGVGAAIADLLLAPVFAPATLIIKACEGAIVGFLSQRMRKIMRSLYVGATFILITVVFSLLLLSWVILSGTFFSGPWLSGGQSILYNGMLNSLCIIGYLLLLVWAVSHISARPLAKLQWKGFTFILGLITGILLILIGSLYYTGEVQLFWGMPPSETPTVTFYVPVEFWYALGTLVIILITIVGFKLEPEFGWLVFAIFLGGLEMVAGYFLYEQFIMGKAAVVEIPVNIGQMLIGLILAVPVVKAVWRALPALKETGQ